MKKTDLTKFNLRSKYELFNILLFNNSLPRANNIDFILHDLAFAAGYSRRLDKPSKKTGNIHEIAFCKYYMFTEKQITEILIHEMIHLWQVDHVAEWRYTKCTNDIAHDKVFTSKMKTINLILQKRGYDYVITEVCKYKLKLDPSVCPKKDYWVFHCECKDGVNTWFKVKDKDFQKIMDEFDSETSHFKNVYAKKEKSYIHNTMEFCVHIPSRMNIDEDFADWKIQNPDCLQIVKNGELQNN